MGLCLSACSPYEIDDPRRDLLQSWADGVLFPRYERTLRELDGLALAAQALCSDPTASTLGSAQDAWWLARAPWKQSEVFSFGPYLEEPLRLGPKIDAWPLRPETVQAVLDDDAPLSASFVDGLGVYAKGFPALEYLLFASPPDLQVAFAAEGRRCQYLGALVDNLHDEVDALYGAWRLEEGAFLAELTLAGSQSERYQSLTEALGEVVNRMGFTVENMQVDKLGAPLGDLATGGPQPELAESTLSGRSVEDMRDNLRGIEALFFANGAGPGLDDYLIEDHRYFTSLMRTRLDAAFCALDAIDLPLTLALSDRREDVERAQDALIALQKLIQIDLLEALTLTLSFNDNDGD